MHLDTPHEPWACTADEVLATLDVDPDVGLSASQARERLAFFGPNELRKPETASAIRVLLRQFRGVLVLLLAAAAGISMTLGDWIEASAVLSVLLINAALGFFTELRAVRSMEALRNLGAPRSRVIRNGQHALIESSQLVPGDIVVVQAGDRLGADVRLVNCSQLQADESLLTGESMPVEKSCEVAETGTFVGDRTCMLHSGTTVVAGAGTGVVSATGPKAEVGKIATLVAEADADDTTPLEKRLDKLAQTLLWFTLVIASAVAVVGIMAGKSTVLVLETAIALAVASVPEGLPILATMILARGVHRMAKHDALVQKLAAVETLGATSIICTDKTGTLTENRMTVDVVMNTDGELAPKAADYNYALHLASWCNNAALSADHRAHSGDPLEIALLQAAHAIDAPEPPPRLREVAFDAKTRMMATIHQVDDHPLAVVKGAPEAVLAVSSAATDHEAWLQVARSMAAQGLRVIAIAQRSLQDANDEAYHDLEPIALVGLLDPPRDGVFEAIAACKSAGIDVCMMTGDHPLTALHIAARLGITDEAGTSITGKELAKLSFDNEDDARRVANTKVFARVSPEQKLRLVEFYQRHGRVVAMTGDGVNDAPALRKADIGVAMGLRGTEVAREASEVVLLNDAFATIVMAVREGRGVFANIRNFVVYLLSCNLSEILVVGIATALRAPLPLLPLQILFLNLVTDVFPALALGATETEESVMNSPPRPPGQKVLGTREWRRILGYGLAITGSVLFAFFYSLYELRVPTSTAVTVSFLSLALAQLWHVFNMTPAGSNWLGSQVMRNGFVWGAIVLCLALLALAVYWRPASSLLSLTPLSGGPLGLALIASALPLVVGFIVRGVGSLRSQVHEPVDKADQYRATDHVADGHRQ